MTMLRVLSAVFVLVVASGCGPLQLASTMERTGDLGAVSAPRADAGSVRLLYGTVPKGFEISADGATLRVQEGFRHQVVGRVKVRIMSNCCCDMGRPVSREVALEMLREKAAAAGANAIVNVLSTLPSENDMEPGCKAVEAARQAAGKITLVGRYETVAEGVMGMAVADGWAVVLAP